MDEEQAEFTQNLKNEARYGSKKTILRLIAAIAICILFFAFISPDAVPLVMLVVGFIMLGILLYAVLRLILVLTGLEMRLKLSKRRAVMLLAVLLPLLLIMLQSLGQLTIRDALTLGGLFVIGVFYLLRLGRSWKSS